MSHAPIINKWPSLSVFAEDIGVTYGTAKAMRRRGSIPSEYWLSAVTKAALRDIKGVSLKELAEAVAKQSEAVQ